jgi:hypothetical protein
MQFTTEAQRVEWLNVSGILAEWLGDSDEIKPMDDQPAWSLTYESTQIFILVQPWTDRNAIVEVRGLVLVNARLDAELAKLLMDMNDKGRGTGFYCIEPGGAIWYRIRIPCLEGGVTRAELEASLGDAAQSADSVDELFQERWGGKRAADLHANPPA